MFVPPAGPAVAAPEGKQAWTDATAECRDARTYVASLRVSGRVGAERLWPVDIETAVTADQSIYLSAVAGGQTVFRLSGRQNRASLWLRADKRVVTATPAEILDAIIGVGVSPAELLGILTGCGTRDTDVVSAERIGQALLVTTRDARVYLRHEAGAWRTHAAVTPSFTIEFGGLARPTPAEVWVWSVPTAPARASLHLRATDPAINADVPADLLELPAAAKAATPLSIEELRANGPLRNRER